MGDFNVIHSMKERSDYFDGTAIPSNVQDFQKCLAALELRDM